MKKMYISMLLFFVVSMQALWSAETQKSEKKIGFSVGYGFQDGLNVSYHYNVLLLRFNYYHLIYNKESFSVTVIPKPQFNITRYKVTNNSLKQESGYEFGLNIGIAARNAFWGDKVAAYLLIGSGPHFVSGAPERQVAGFIFSDNIATGLDVKLSDRLRLDIAAGFRHISNAGLKRPNGGVNNIFLYSGLIFLMNPTP